MFNLRRHLLKSIVHVIRVTTNKKNAFFWRYLVRLSPDNIFLIHWIKNDHALLYMTLTLTLNGPWPNIRTAHWLIILDICNEVFFCKSYQGFKRYGVDNKAKISMSPYFTEGALGGYYDKRILAVYLIPKDFWILFSFIHFFRFSVQ